MSQLSRILAVAILPLTIVPLILEPDFGQTMLISVVWASLFFMAGLSLYWVVGVGGVGVLGAFAAYKLSPHVHDRVLRFLNPEASGGLADTFQVDTAVQSLLSGGWFGRGPGEGVYKRILPDAHTDFVFAVAGEEFGLIACLALDRAVRLRRAALVGAGQAQPRSVLPLRRGGHGDPVRRAKLDQHGGQRQGDAGQGHDLAVHLLWRLVAAGAGARHGLPDRADAAAPDGGSAHAPGKLMPGPKDHCCWPPGAPAAICFRPPRWRRR